MDKIKLLDYVSGKGWVESGEEVSPSDVARGMTAQNFTDVIGEFVNIGMKDFRQGVEIGHLLHWQHRTLQASVFRLMLGIMKGLSEQEYTDPRNEQAVKCAKQITDMLEDGTLNMGYLI